MSQPIGNGNTGSGGSGLGDLDGGSGLGDLDGGSGTGTGTGSGSGTTGGASSRRRGFFAGLGNRNSQLWAGLRANRRTILKWIILFLIAASILWWMNHKFASLGESATTANNAEIKADQALDDINGTKTKPGIWARIGSLEELVMSSLGLRYSKETKQIEQDPDGMSAHVGTLWTERGQVNVDLDGDGKPDDLSAAFKQVRLAIWGGKDAKGQDFNGLAKSMQVLESRQDKVESNSANNAARAEAATKKALADSQNEAIKKMIAEVKEMDPTSKYNKMSEADINTGLNDGNNDFENEVKATYNRLTIVNTASATIQASVPDMSQFATKADVQKLHEDDQTLARADAALAKPKHGFLAPSVREKDKVEARTILAPYLPAPAQEPAPPPKKEKAKARPFIER